MPQRIESLDVSIEELEQLVDCAGQGPLPPEGQRKLKAAVATLGVMAGMLGDKDTTIRKLRELLTPTRTTEKTKKVLDSTAAEAPNPEPERKPASRKKGHGRNGPGAYTGARKVRVPHPAMKRADHCPECQKGKLYPLSEPKSLIRIIGQAPVEATVYELEALRCNLCGVVFTAPPPAGVGTEKYDASALGMIALLKYGSGIPFYRLQKLESNLGIPLAPATQWQLVSEAAAMLAPAGEELIRQAAQGSLVHNDDTSMRILNFEREPGDPRTGLFTSGIVSIGARVESAFAAGHRIAAFFTGSQHAGENLADVLRRRAKELAPPIQMCDALSRNAPAAFLVMLANCIAHARRHFVDVVNSFPSECRYVLETLREVFHFDVLVKEQGLTPQERLIFHQQNSRPLMDGLHRWCKLQFEERNVEPNSGLGKAIQYLLNHWQKLTLFLHVPGAPLDNNICERALKKAILHRKNALFYRTINGARVGDLFMSLIHTAELGGVNPFDYLTELLRHPKEVAQAPANWMPWNYRENLVHAADLAA